MSTAIQVSKITLFNSDKVRGGRKYWIVHASVNAVMIVVFVCRNVGYECKK